MPNSEINNKMDKLSKLSLVEKKSKKSCFGTKEWSNNSGICNGCDLKKACGKIKLQKV